VTQAILCVHFNYQLTYGIFPDYMSNDYTFYLLLFRLEGTGICRPRLHPRN